MTDFEIWLQTTKQKNLTFEKLEYEIGTCNYSYYAALKGEGSQGKAEILFNFWKNEKPDDLEPLIKLLKEIS